MPRDSIWLEIAVYTVILLAFVLTYVAIMKYGIPWYYCHYYYVCL